MVYRKNAACLCDSIIDVIKSPSYHKQSDRAIPSNLKVPNEDSHPQFICFDFGICENEKGELEPQLVEMQAFLTLFAWHTMMPEISAKHFDEPNNYSPYLNGFTKESYLQLLKKIIVGDAKTENVILLEIFPHQQKTRVDFYATEDLIGIRTVCLTEIIKEGKKLFYMHAGERFLFSAFITGSFLTTCNTNHQKCRKKENCSRKNWMLIGYHILTGFIASASLDCRI